MTSNMQNLESIQHWMHTALIFPRNPDNGRSGDILRSFPGLSGMDGLAIYQRSYFLRIASCMREQFPALCRTLGADLFNDFVSEYIRRYPPTSYTLYDLGRRFPAFLHETRPDQQEAEAAPTPWVDFMVDLARFERQVFVMFDTPGQEGTPLADVSTPDENLSLQPAFDIGTYAFPVAAYYHAVRRDLNPELPPHETSHVALVRTDYLTHTIPLAPTHYVFLEAMKKGCTVQEALEAVSNRFALPLETVQTSWAEEDGIRKRWIESGFFTASR